MRHYFMKALGENPQLCDQSSQAEVRARFFDHYVTMPDAVVTDPNVAAEKSDINGLYIGAHECSDMRGQDVFVELWAYADDPDPDWVGWEFFVDGQHILAAITFCPFCGLNLSQLINDNID